jgi:hypothetical protein
MSKSWLMYELKMGVKMHLYHSADEREARALQ